MKLAAIVAPAAMIAACASPGPPPAVVEIGGPSAAPPAIVTSAVAPPAKAHPPAAKVITWETSVPDAEARARRGSPMIVWARADWIAAATQMERGAWADPRVVEAARGFVALRLDLTNADDLSTELLAQRFRVTALPTIVIMDARGARTRTIIGLTTPEAILAALAEVAD